jgi:hypothetical protein
VPTQLWRKANYKKTLDGLYLAAFDIDSNKNRYRGQMMGLAGKVFKAKEGRREDEIAGMVEIMIQELPEEFKAANGVVEGDFSKVTYEEVVKLHRELKDLVSENERNEW